MDSTIGQILSKLLFMSKYNIVYINVSEDAVGSREKDIDLLSRYKNGAVCVNNAKTAMTINGKEHCIPTKNNEGDPAKYRKLCS
jgi:hypothetical protein